MQEHTRKVGDRGQVTIPKDLRRRKGIQSGDEVVFVERDDSIVIQHPADEERLAEGYRTYADRARRLASEMDETSAEATERLGDAPGWSK